MRDRRRFNFSPIDFIYNYANIFKCFLFCFKKSKKKSIYRRFKFYENGEEAYMKEFDAAYYAKSIRKLQMLVNALMDDRERFLANYQKSYAIPLHSDVSESNEDEEEFMKVPKLTSKRQNTELHNQIVNSFFDNNYLKEKLTDKDFKILNGVYNRGNLRSMPQFIA